MMENEELPIPNGMTELTDEELIQISDGIFHVAPNRTFTEGEYFVLEHVQNKEVSAESQLHEEDFQEIIEKSRQYAAFFKYLNDKH